MQNRALIIKRFALGPLAQWGFVGGALIACLPGFLCSWFLFSLAQAFKGVLGGWRDVGFEVLGQRLSFNLVQALKLENLLELLTNIAGFGIFGIFLLALVLAAGLGLFGAMVTTLLGLFYNATGRIRIEVEEVENDAAQA